MSTLRDPSASADLIPTGPELRPAKGYAQEKLPEYELSDQQHFLNMLPAFVQDAVIKLPPEYLDMSEEELKELCFGDKTADIPATHYRLQMSIWDEYERCRRYGIRALDLQRVIQGICTLGYFANRFMAEPKNVAWLIHPPGDYMRQMKEILQLSMDQLRQIVLAPNTDSKGRFNTRLADVKFRIHQHVDMRVKGAIIQRIDQRNLSVNVTGQATEEQTGRIIDQLSAADMPMDQVDAKLKELEQKSLALSAPARVEVDLMSAITKPVAVVMDEARQQEETAKGHCKVPDKVPANRK